MTAGKSAALAPAPAVRLAEQAGRLRLGRRLSWILGILSVGAALATYAALTGALPFAADPGSVLVLLNIDLALLLVLGAIVARRLIGIWLARRRGSVGARLHTRLVLWFGLIALVPAIIVSVSSAVFFSIGIQGWFSERVRTALAESLLVAEAYLREHRQAIRGDLLAMARDVNRSAPTLWGEPARLSRLLAAQALLRGLSEAYIFDGTGRVLAQWNLSFVLDHDPVPVQALREARGGEAVVLIAGSEDRMRAIVRLDAAFEAFLYIGRFVEPRVLDHVSRTEDAVAHYQSLEGQRTTFEITFAMMFVLVALLLLMAAIWVGVTLATRLAGPISALASAAERVRRGDLATRVAAVDGDDEIASLADAFNRMTAQLETHHRDLVAANRQIESRRRFIETVLSGVSAGVIGLDAEGRINLANRSASQLLSLSLDERAGEHLGRIVPEMAAPLAEARTRADRLAEAVVELPRDGAARTLLVRVVADRHGEEKRGFVVTFDDITELQSAQRKAAWADVAQRVAHEIKNPLTPIQLSAERIRAKFAGEIESDPAAFGKYTEIIIRHVRDIGGMVDKFSEFARLPEPIVVPGDLVDAVRHALILQGTAYPEIELVTRIPERPMVVPCDPGLVGRALTNLLKNAVEAIESRVEDARAPPPVGRITVSLEEVPDGATLTVEDNGRGLPAGDRDRLTEPYVTTRAKGTGLGLAIVRKIMEDHGGSLSIGDADGGGARIALAFPKRAAAAAGGER